MNGLITPSGVYLQSRNDEIPLSQTSVYVPNGRLSLMDYQIIWAQKSKLAYSMSKSFGRKLGDVQVDENVSSFASELLKLEENISSLHTKFDFLAYYNDVAQIISNYANRSEDLAEAKILKYLYTSALTRLSQLNAASKSRLVIDVDKFLSSAKENIYKLEKKNNVKTIKSYKEKYAREIEAKIEEARFFVTSLVRDIERSGNALDEQLKKHLEKIEQDIKTAAANAEDLAASRAQIQNAVVKTVLFEIKDLNGFTPSHKAISQGHVRVLDLLLTKGASIYTTTKQGQTPLELAKIGDHEEVIKLLEERVAGSKKLSPDLLMAVQSGKCKVVASLLKQGANIDFVDSDNQTLLHLAAKNGHVDIMQLLINRGVDIEAVAKKGLTPLILAVQTNQQEAVKLLLNKGANFYAATESGNTSLHWSALNGYYNIAEILLNEGADLRARNNDGQTPLHVAVQKADLQITKLFLDRGADFASCDQEGRSPLDIAKLYNYKSIMDLLVERLEEQWSVELLLEKENGQTEIIKLLLNKTDNLPLNLSSINDKQKIMGLVPDKNVDGKDYYEWIDSPLHWAKQNNHQEIVELITNAKVETMGDTLNVVDEDF